MMIKKITNIFKREEKKPVSLNSLEGDSPVVIKKTATSSTSSSFMGDFDITKVPGKTIRTSEAVVEDEIWTAVTPKPMKMTKENKDLLKRSIVISLDFPVERPDLQFIANSRVDGRPIYRYVGGMPFKLDIPFEELMSLEDYTNSSPQLVDAYVDYIAEAVSPEVKKQQMRDKWVEKYGSLHRIIE